LLSLQQRHKQVTGFTAEDVRQKKGILGCARLCSGSFLNGPEERFPRENRVQKTPGPAIKKQNFLRKIPDCGY
jgi:hypothetical protein